MRNSSKRQPSLVRLAALSGRRKRLLIEAFLTLAVYKGLLLVLPFKFFLRKEQPESVSSPTLDEQYVSDVVWAVRVVSSRLPLGFTCLVQALSAKWLLKQDASVRLCIGVQKNSTQDFSAHAWLVYQRRIILGEQEGQPFQPILEWS